MPRLGWLLAIAALAGMGMPLMTGFVAEYLVLLASFTVFNLKSVLPLIGVALTGAYMVRLISFTAFGRPRKIAKDVSVRTIPFIILLALSVVLGTLPFLLLRIIQSSSLT